MTNESRADLSDIRLAVIGAGTGGYPAAFLAAELGMQVTLVDPEPHPGGVCLYRGCIPSKALLHAAALLHDARSAEQLGIRFGEPTVDLEQLRGWKDAVVAQLTSGLGQLTRARHVNYRRGRARFLDAHTLHVANDGDIEQLGFDYAIVATGSSPTIPGALAIDSDRVWDSTAALELPEIPERLLVVGGGYIGLELGSVYEALGSAVTVVEMTGGLLPGADADLVAVLERALRPRFAAIHLRTTVTALEETAAGVRVTLSGADHEHEEVEVDRVLIAVGRRPNSAGLGLEQLATVVNERGFVTVDGQRRTAEPTVFAVGDVAGEPMLAHKATHEARVAVETIAGQPARWDPAAIPAVVFTDPELAWTGLNESEAQRRGIDVDAVTFPWSASGRATTLAANQGLTKLVLEPRTQRIIGVGIVGRGAGELMGEATLAVEMGARADDLRLTIHTHPTLAETLMESAELLFNSSPHYIAKRR